MFERRLKILLVLLALPMLVAAGRLVHLTAVWGSHYQAAALDMLELPPRYYPALRGSITDYEGVPLAYDAPAWDIAVHYGLLVADDALTRQMRRQLGLRPEDLGRERVEESLYKVVELTGVSRPKLREEAEQIIHRVERIKQLVSRRRGVETLIQEETAFHPLTRGLDQERAVEARVALAAWPWFSVVPGHTRKYEGGAAFGHLLGLVAPVPESLLDAPSNPEDPLTRYQMDDTCGVRGIEALGESWLRGIRGRTHHDRTGKEVSPPIDPRAGRDVRLTLDAALQRMVYERLGAAIETNYPASTGGCAVILDVPSRQVLALVSYPAVDPAAPPEGEPDARTQLREPWLFRAVRKPYSPGSIVKPMLLAASLTDRTTTSGTRSTCGGHLFADQPDKWGCTGIHGSVEPIYAIQHSCNIFFYELGQRMSVDAEARWMDRFGLGRLSGTGLLDEVRGMLPTKENPGEARLAAIGQGEFEMTPIQAANMTATLATGVWRPVRLWANDPTSPPEPAELPISREAWRIVREGMFRAVNAEGGTAYGTDKLRDLGPYVLLGKTGSAEVSPPEWIYTCRFPNGAVESYRSRTAKSLVQQWAPDERPEIIGRTAPAEYDQTHGWFIGYLAPRGRYLEPVTSADLSIAVAVVVEYAGHGGEVAAPIAADLVDAALLRVRGQTPPGTEAAP